MFAAMAISLFNTPESIATPCSVKAKGGADVFLLDDITKCDVMFFAVSSMSKSVRGTRPIGTPGAGQGAWGKKLVNRSYGNTFC